MHPLKTPLQHRRRLQCTQRLCGKISGFRSDDPNQFSLCLEREYLGSIQQDVLASIPARDLAPTPRPDSPTVRHAPPAASAGPANCGLAESTASASTHSPASVNSPPPRHRTLQSRAGRMPSQLQSPESHPTLDSGSHRSRPFQASADPETPSPVDGVPICASAARPLSASPTISISGSNSNSSRRILRAIGSSSTISVLIFLFVLSPTSLIANTLPLNGFP